jgi:hypothetical protein
MTWLIGLFASPERAEAIAGDLEEEARIRGRAWYWRQVIATIPHLFANQLRATPWSVLGFGILTIVVFDALLASVEMSARQLVAHYEVYHVIPAATFWSAMMAMEIYGTPLVAGWIVGKIARDRAVTSIVVMNVAFNAVAIVANVVHWPYSAQSFTLADVLPKILLRATIGMLLMIAGAAVAQLTRARDYRDSTLISG